MKALLVIDVQNDFLPEGALAVPEGDQVVPVINHLIEQFEHVIATQDWHPSDHGSFAANHLGKKPGDVILLNDLDQILWPVHCVQGSRGAEFSPLLKTERFERIFQKGTNKGIDSYSGFFDNGHLKSTGLADYLEEKGFDELYLTGLAADYCVKFSALDAIKLGLKTKLGREATRAVNLKPDDLERSLDEMEVAGVEII
jgi:nicotinamidase/pyrazinamidase